MKRILAMGALAALSAAACGAGRADNGGYVIDQVEAMPRWPWEQKVDVRFRALKPGGEGATFGLVVSNGTEEIVASSAALRQDFFGGEGHARLVWDHTVDCPGRTLKNATFHPFVAAAVPPAYLIVDLETGATWHRDAAFAAEVNSDLYKTTRMAFRYCPPTTSAAWKTVSGGADYFLMGASAEEAQDPFTYCEPARAQPQHPVTLTQGFYLGVFEVTQKQWALLMDGARPSRFNNADVWETRPVENVNFRSVRNSNTWPAGGHATGGGFAGRLTQLVGGRLAFDLPTEAQWEYACRAGTTGAWYAADADRQMRCYKTWRGTAYSANVLARRKKDGAFVNTDAADAALRPQITPDEGGTVAVGSYAPNPWGFYDMLGNVAEFTLDAATGLGANKVVAYTADAQTDPAGAVLDDPYRTARGGYWYDYAKLCTVYYRQSAWYGEAVPYTNDGKTLLQGVLGCRLCATVGAAASAAAPAAVAGWTLGAATVTTRLPWSNLVDIRFTAAAPDGAPAEVGFGLTAVNGGETFDIPAEDLVRADDGTSGTVHLVWNPAATHPGRAFSGFAAVPYVAYNDDRTYLDVDLETGEATWRGAAFADEVNADRYKTTHLVLRRVPSTLSAAWTAQVGGRTWFEACTASAALDLTSLDHVTLTRDAYIGVFEVTQKQYELVTGSNPSHYTVSRETRPVENVCYNDLRGGTSDMISWPSTGAAVAARSFFGKLRAKTGLDFDLPTAACWEHAARAGHEGAWRTVEEFPIPVESCARFYPRTGWNTTRAKAADAALDEGGPLPVGSLRPNDWGLYDMQGNVMELVLDFAFAATDVNAPRVLTDPPGGASGLNANGEKTGNRQARGGSWWYYDIQSRPSAKSAVGPAGTTIDSGVYDIGFRVALAR